MAKIFRRQARSSVVSRRVYRRVSRSHASRDLSPSRGTAVPLSVGCGGADLCPSAVIGAHGVCRASCCAGEYRAACVGVSSETDAVSAVPPHALHHAAVHAAVAAHSLLPAADPGRRIRETGHGRPENRTTRMTSVDCDLQGVSMIVTENWWSSRDNLEESKRKLSTKA